MMEDVIRTDLVSGNYRDTRHSKYRTEERNVTRLDIECCARDGIITKQENGTYLVTGLDSSDENLDLVCGYDNGTLIITAY